MAFASPQKVCVVTGASRGVGKGVAIELAKDGNKVYITGRNVDTLNAVAREVRSAEGTIHPIQCDHTVDEQVDRLFAQIDAENDGQLDLLVNNVYAAAKYITENLQLPFWDLPPDGWDVFNSVGLRNHYRCTVLCSRLMVKRRCGLIVNITSIATFGYVITPPYTIGKSAIDRMTSDCAIELRKYGVTFISLWPGSVRTEHFVETMSKEESSFSDKNEAKYLLDHGESASFVGKAVVHLLTDLRVFQKTGQIISTAQAARKYGFSDNGRRPVDFTCLKDLIEASGYGFVAKFIPEFIRLPRWILGILLNYSALDKKKSIYS